MPCKRQRKQSVSLDYCAFLIFQGNKGCTLNTSPDYCPEFHQV